LQAADLVEEPATACVHEQTVSLHFLQPECPLNAQGLDAGAGVIAQEPPHRLFAAIEDNIDVGVASLPWVREELLADAEEQFVEPTFEVIERLTEWAAPFLLPIR